MQSSKTTKKPPKLSAGFSIPNVVTAVTVVTVVDILVHR